MDENRQPTVPPQIPPDIPEGLDLTLLANFVHQVVNPLNGVAGTLDNLADGVIRGEARRIQRLNAARAQIEQCITLMRNLAFLARGSGGVADDDRRTVVLPQVIIEGAMYYQEDGATKRINISLDDKETQNRVSGHPELIRQVIMNIIENGVKYSKSPSTIHINHWIQSIDGKMYSADGDAIIEIRSVPEHKLGEDEIERIFDLGYRGLNAKKTVASGTGLGLYICRQIVEHTHGGSIYARSHQDGGLSFYIKLPNGSMEAGRDNGKGR